MPTTILIIFGWLLISRLLAKQMIFRPISARSNNDIRAAPYILNVNAGNHLLPVNLSLSSLKGSLKQPFVRNSLGLSRKNHKVLGADSRKKRKIKRQLR